MKNKNTWAVETSINRIDEIENRINRKDPHLKSIFTQTFLDDAREQAQGLDPNNPTELAGALVSVKDLLDVKGHVTKAGTQFLKFDKPAKNDALCIKNLRNSGAIFVGHTNMTELAYSGLGLNPHYGTPENALYEGCIPGGSTSGGAISVAKDVVDIAIGTDTGGSLRIPAAFNGIVGFKPTQGTVSRDGCKALSYSLDSIGPMAKSVSACRIAYRVLAGDMAGRNALTAPNFVVPTNYGMDDLEPAVAEAFEIARQRLVSAGYQVTEAKIDALEELKSLAVWQFASIESRSEYDEAYQAQRDIMDPRVASPTRMGRADEVDAISYRKTLNLREKLIKQYRDEMSGKILLMPTVPILPPTFESMEDDDTYSRVNLQVLRNPSIANVMDCCSISLPFTQGDSTIGIMLIAGKDYDLGLLDLAEELEAKVLRS